MGISFRLYDSNVDPNDAAAQAAVVIQEILTKYMLNADLVTLDFVYNCFIMCDIVLKFHPKPGNDND